jgi:hypothetical protein
MQADRCYKCGGPLGAAATRCTLCGADLCVTPPDALAAIPKFTPAIVGLRSARRPTAARKPALQPTILWLVAALGMFVLAGVGFAGYRLLAVPAPTVASAPPAPPSAPPPLTLQGVSIPDPARVDATDLLPSVRKRVVEGAGDYRLVEIVVSHARNGSVDLSRPGSQIAYRYQFDRQDPRADRNDRDRIELTVSASAPVFLRTKAATVDEPVQEPTCVWSAAWRAALASGFTTTGDVDARYGKRSKAERPMWVFTSLDKPDLRSEIDGMTCTIRAR